MFHCSWKFFTSATQHVMFQFYFPTGIFWKLFKFMVNHHSNTQFFNIQPCLENALAYINVASHTGGFRGVLFSPSFQGRNASPPKNMCVWEADVNGDPLVSDMIQWSETWVNWEDPSQDWWKSIGSSAVSSLSLIHIWRCRRSTLCRSRWSPYH